MGLRTRPVAWWELASESRADQITEGVAKVTGARRAYAEACIQARRQITVGDGAGAISILEPVVASSPTSIDAHRLLGIALLETNEPARARRPFEVALEGDPTDLVAQIGIAEVEEATEGPAVAFRAWRRAWELEPNFEPVSSRLREVRKVQIAEGSASAPFTTDGSIDGPIAHTHQSLARARFRAGLHHHAMLDAMEALRHDRSRVDVQLLLAEAWWRSGETEVAHDVAASILEVAPNCVAANLLVAVHRRSVSRDPRQQVERARQADPFDRIAHQLFAGRDVPPVMDDAWSGDQWSASRATYGEWPLVAVMPRAVAVVRAQLAAEKAAAEAAEQARMEAEAEERRRKAAEEAAKKPAAGAFKGTGVISDTPAKPAPEKTEGAGANGAPPKPAGFKGSGVIAEDEPVFKSKSRRPPGTPTGADGNSSGAPSAPTDGQATEKPVAELPAPADQAQPSQPVAADAPLAKPAESSSSPDAMSSLSAAEASVRAPSEVIAPVMPDGVAKPAPEASVEGLSASTVEGAPIPTQPVPMGQGAPSVSAIVGETAPARSGKDVTAEGSLATASDATPHVEKPDPRSAESSSVPTSPDKDVSDGLVVRPAEGTQTADRVPSVFVAGSERLDADDTATLRAIADAAFHGRRFTDAVRAYAALLRRI